MLSRYVRWLKKQQRVSLVKELTELFFLLFWPIAALWAVNPSIYLNGTAQNVQRLIGIAYLVINLFFFYYKTRSARRGLFL